MNIPFMNNEDKKVQNVVLGVIVVLGLFLMVQTINSIKEYGAIGKGQYPDSTISFTGTGEVFAVPDTATFTFSVTKEAKTVKDAQDMVAKVVDQATKDLKDAGIKDVDVKTTDYSVFPRYEYPRAAIGQTSKRVFTGYEVTQTTQVKVRDAAVSGEVLGAVGALDISNISGLSFEVDDEDSLIREARTDAIAEAKEKAEALSKDLGVKLVRIISFYENSGDVRPYYAMAEKAGMGGDAVTSAPSISTGQNKISSQVTITYEIE